DAWFAWLRSDLQPRTVALFVNNLTLRSDEYFSQGLRAWASQQVRLYPEGPAKINAVVAKNSFAPHPPFNMRWRFLGDASFDANYELIRLGLETGVLTRGGVWVKYQGSSMLDYILGQGVRQSVDYLKREPKLVAVIREAIIARLS